LFAIPNSSGANQQPASSGYLPQHAKSESFRKIEPPHGKSEGRRAVDNNFQELQLRLRAGAHNLTMPYACSKDFGHAQPAQSGPNIWGFSNFVSGTGGRMLSA
jgi:hypothetical protein